MFKKLSLVFVSSVSQRKKSKGIAFCLNSNVRSVTGNPYITSTITFTVGKIGFSFINGTLFNVSNTFTMYFNVTFIPTCSLCSAPPPSFFVKVYKLTWIKPENHGSLLLIIKCFDLSAGYVLCVLNVMYFYTIN